MTDTLNPPPRPLQAWRKAREMSQRELARRAQVSQGMISLIEAGKHSPRVEIAQRIARTLGVATDDIAWGKSEEPSAD